MHGGRKSAMGRLVKEHAMDQLNRGPDEPPVEMEETVERLDRERRRHADPYGISRRDLLKAGGVLGAGIAGLAISGGQAAATPRAQSPSSPRLVPQTPHQPRIVVVGAGLAGMGAAYALRQVGVPVDIYEARDRIGGRCWTAHGFADGQTAEHGGEFIDSRHLHILRLAKRLDLPIDDLWKDFSGTFSPIWDWGGYLHRTTIHPQMQVLGKRVTELATRLGVFGPHGKGKPTTRPFTYGTATPAAKALDRLSMTEWLAQHDKDLLGTRVGAWLNENMNGWYGLDMNQMSAVNWLDYFCIPYPGADERWHVKGGNDRIIHSTAAKLPPGTIHTNTALRAVKKAANGTYHLTFDGVGSTVVADILILTLPFTTLREVDLAHAGYSAHKMEVINTMAMGHDAKVLLQYDRRPQKFENWTGDMDSVNPNFDTWESSARQKGKAGLITVYAGGRTGGGWSAPNAHGPAPVALRDQLLHRIDQAVPGTKRHFNGHAWADLWPQDPWTQGAYAAFGVGQYTTCWGGTSQHEDNTHFAGEATSTYSQGYLNGGTESGFRVSIEVMRKLGIKVPKWLAALPYSPA